MVWSRLTLTFKKCKIGFNKKNKSFEIILDDIKQGNDEFFSRYLRNHLISNILRIKFSISFEADKTGFRRGWNSLILLSKGLHRTVNFVFFRLKLH